MQKNRLSKYNILPNVKTTKEREREKIDQKIKELFLSNDIDYDSAIASVLAGGDVYVLYEHTLATSLREIYLNTYYLDNKDYIVKIMNSIVQDKSEYHQFAPKKIQNSSQPTMTKYVSFVTKMSNKAIVILLSIIFTLSSYNLFLYLIYYYGFSSDILSTHIVFKIMFTSYYSHFFEVSAMLVILYMLVLLFRSLNITNPKQRLILATSIFIATIGASIVLGEVVGVVGVGGVGVELGVGVGVGVVVVGLVVGLGVGVGLGLGVGVGLGLGVGLSRVLPKYSLYKINVLSRYILATYIFYFLGIIFALLLLSKLGVAPNTILLMCIVSLALISIYTMQHTYLSQKSQKIEYVFAFEISKLAFVAFLATRVVSYYDDYSDICKISTSMNEKYQPLAEQYTTMSQYPSIVQIDGECVYMMGYDTSFVHYYRYNDISINSFITLDTTKPLSHSMLSLPLSVGNLQSKPIVGLNIKNIDLSSIKSIYNTCKYNITYDNSNLE